MAGRLVRVTVGGVPRVVDLLRGQDYDVATTLTPASGYLANPGIGYQGATYETGLYAQSTEYLRGPDQGGLDWATMNPAAGVYDWDPVDDLLEAADGRGQRAAFRILTMVGYGFGSHCVPGWVVTAGAIITDLPDDEPDYRARAYQLHWGTFVDALADRYDGDDRIAFIDISGYGLANEWKASAFTDGGDDTGYGSSVDSSTKRHLIHMFVGGTGTAKCLEANAVTEGTLSYDHPGFVQTQLVMPYGGQWGPTRYVLDNYPHVGFRNDALLSPDAEADVLGLIGHGVTQRWLTAPMVFEPIVLDDPDDYGEAYPAGAETLAAFHACLLHENAQLVSSPELAALIEPLGYRYVCTEVRGRANVVTGSEFTVHSDWENVGYAKAYPRMGQDFTVGVALAGAGGAVSASWATGHDVSAWLPGEAQTVAADLTAPEVPGTYTLLVGVVDVASGSRILLPLPTGGRSDRWYPAGSVGVT